MDGIKENNFFMSSYSYVILHNIFMNVKVCVKKINLKKVRMNIDEHKYTKKNALKYVNVMKIKRGKSNLQQLFVSK